MSTTIQWTNETWNPTTGCTRVSEGCRHCYIERTPPFRMAGRKFVNGTTGVQLHPGRLDAPLHWKKPRRVFVNSLSDLFHEDIPREFIKSVVGVTVDCPQHTFQILTKRPQRMLEFSRECPWPSNVWLGVSVEDQATADERIPILLQTPAAVRFISAEPLLETINLNQACWGLGRNRPPIDIAARQYQGNALSALDWAILGGESGPGARPCNLAWIRALKDQCQAAQVPVFVKQLGSVPLNLQLDGLTRLAGTHGLRTFNKKGDDMSEWPEDLRVREFPL